MTKGGIILIILVIVVCTIVVMAEQRKSRRIMNTLNRMVDAALNDDFTEDLFDESMLSAVESRLNRYLKTATVSERNLKVEKERIKELLSDISHQTKTPMANILLYAQLLEEQDLSKDSASCVTSLKNQADKLNFLIASLVKLSRLETGVFVLNPTSQNIMPLVEEAVNQLQAKAGQKGIDLAAGYTEASAIFDYKWTLEVLCNILDNAVKYTPSGGQVKVSVIEYDLFCRIDVRDTGMGIAESDQAKIFNRFYRSASVSDEEGLGLGLYLACQILASEGGYIKVSSVEGEGATFSLFLPR